MRKSPLRSTRNTWGERWEFRTKRFRVALELERERGFKYDGDDEGGEIQRDLDSGELVAFNSKVFVELDGVEIAADYLGASVYKADSTHEFFAPKTRDYFADMVRSVIFDARKHVAAMTPPPVLRHYQESIHAP